jgi:outer membrane protein assembly factor BamE
VANLFKPFRLDIAQGNYLTEEALERVKPGMKRQSPLLSDPFHPNRWDYIFRFQKGNGEAISRRVTIYFEGELVTKVDADKLPGRDDPNDPALPRGRQR